MQRFARLARSRDLNICLSVFRSSLQATTLLRQSLQEKRAAFDKKQVSEAELNDVTNKAVEEAVKLQKEVGLKVS